MLRLEKKMEKFCFLIQVINQLLAFNLECDNNTLVRLPAADLECNDNYSCYLHRGKFILYLAVLTEILKWMEHFTEI
jgi:hypothetical protein